MAIKRTIRGIRDKIPPGYVLGRSGTAGSRQQGPVQLIKFTPSRDGGVGGGGSGSGVTTIAIEMYAGGLMRANEVVGQIIAPVEFTLPATLPDSYAKAVSASTGAVVLTIRKATAAGGVGSSIGTITFTNSTEGVIVFASDVAFAVGDRLLVQCPNPANASLASTTILLVGNL
jgi:hypothetical protein